VEKIVSRENSMEFLLALVWHAIGKVIGWIVYAITVILGIDESHNDKS
jgi:hypothetical protein